MKKICLLFSHILLEDQILELKNTFLCDEIIYLPRKLQELWSNVEDEKDCSQLFFEFLKRNLKENDYVLIQGEWGLTYKMINFCKKNKFIPIYSFSKRVAHEEIKNGVIQKTSYFKHIKFKEYREK